MTREAILQTLLAPLRLAILKVTVPKSTWLLPLCLAVPLSAAEPRLLQAMTEELQRNFQVLRQKADPAPYFLGYEVTEQHSQALSASLGAITGKGTSRNRSLDVTIRVGSPKLDNYHRVRGERVQFTSGSPLSLDDNPNAIKQRLWLETDRAYRASAERLIKIKTNTQVKVAEEDSSDDFSTETPSQYQGAVPELHFDAAAWTARLRKLSAVMSKYPGVLVSGVTAVAQTDMRYIVNSEGTRIAHGRGYARVMIMAQGKAADGMDLATSESFEANDARDLPADKVLLATIDRVARDLVGQLTAPVVEPYIGPAIFSGRAAGVFFHEIFGHRIEGHRQKDETEGQTFTKSIGTKVLPDFLSVVFDPTREKLNGTELNGWYKYDDEGVKARPLSLIDHGVLKTFLMSRSPVAGFNASNGHGRRQPGYEVVSRQSNLIVESSRAVTFAKLREMLIEELKKQNKPHGLFFREVTGGFTNTSRGGVQAFKVLPLVVYRIYADGRPDELVRGADIVGTPLSSFAKIIATSDKTEIFNGYCGAESGSVPVSAASPALLVSEIEIEKRAKSQERPPLLPEPKAEPTQGGVK